MLVEHGFLTHDERDDRDHDRYYPKERLIDDWIEIQRERE